MSVKKSLVVSLCILFFLITISYAVNANVISIAPNVNNPPNPPVITGPSSGKVRQPYTYYVTISDPDEEDLLIKVEVNFGDGVTSCGGCDGRGPWESGAVVDFEHTWKRQGNFSITSRVQDEHGVWGDWSDPLPIAMPYHYSSIQQFLEWLFGWFTYLFSLQ